MTTRISYNQIHISRSRPFLPVRVPRAPPIISFYHHIRMASFQPMKALSTLREPVMPSNQGIQGEMRSRPVEAASAIWAFVTQIGKKANCDTDNKKGSEIKEQEIVKVDVKKEPEGDIQKSKKLPPNIWRFLKPVPTVEVQLVRVMASLSNLAYYMSKVTFKSLLRRYGYELVTTSLSCKQATKEPNNDDAEAMMIGDGMAINTEIANAYLESVKNPVKERVSNNIVVANTHLEDLGKDRLGNDGGETENKDIVKSKRQEGWNVATTVGAAGSLYSATMVQLAKQILSAATFSQTAVSVTFGRVMGLLQAAINPGPPSSESSAAGRKVSVRERIDGKCPGEWFVCDNPRQKTRIFCIQGTDSLDAWHTNLKFDPVSFEDKELGVMAHRGAYEAAKGLFNLFSPLVQEYVEENPDGKIYFAGHSLGGAICSLLLMMMVHRGVLDRKNVGQVHTFGGAASICDVSHCSDGKCHCGCDTDPQKQSCKNECEPPNDILTKLGLPLNTIVNVVMHRDIVPRAYACDYSPVAKFLTQWGPSFKAHACLNRTGRALLYSFPGEIQVLQPEGKRTYVRDEGYHSMLPYGAGLYRITDPEPGLRNTLSVLQQSLADSSQEMLAGPEVKDMREAILAFMDNPHPLEILADKGAYGDVGAISRYHNPANYANAVQSVLTVRRRTSLIPFTPGNAFIDNIYSKRHAARRRRTLLSTHGVKRYDTPEQL